MNPDSEQLRGMYESALKVNPSDSDAIQYLAVWHLERHSFQQARQYFSKLSLQRPNHADVWLSLSVCCAMAEEFDECGSALQRAQGLIPLREEDVRVKFCRALMAEKRKDFTTAMEGYVNCLNQCASGQEEGQSQIQSLGQSSSSSADGGTSG
eukprot:CAMPEP_0173309500 /NCGR_PEP_ID=MMETSP1143-20121109/22364_1 /TAXON_ID=483371 /ORGANISM="non described non described, Strain CCMP2298" /LENGTH=152 /DNA_ID=CAMNT_0014251097 /DNA_START=59 /DNA_END=513 /DNA_ORIENTATION=-